MHTESSSSLQSLSSFLRGSTTSAMWSEYQRALRSTLRLIEPHEDAATPLINDCRMGASDVYLMCKWARIPSMSSGKIKLASYRTRPCKARWRTGFEARSRLAKVQQAVEIFATTRTAWRGNYARLKRGATMEFTGSSRVFVVACMTRFA